MTVDCNVYYTKRSQWLSVANCAKCVCWALNGKPYFGMYLMRHTRTCQQKKGHFIRLETISSEIKKYY